MHARKRRRSKATSGSQGQSTPTHRDHALETEAGTLQPTQKSNHASHTQPRWPPPPPPLPRHYVALQQGQLTPRVTLHSPFVGQPTLSIDPRVKRIAHLIGGYIVRHRQAQLAGGPLPESPLPQLLNIIHVKNVAGSATQRHESQSVAGIDRNNSLGRPSEVAVNVTGKDHHGRRLPAPVMAEQPAPVTAVWSAPAMAQQPAPVMVQQPAPVMAAWSAPVMAQQSAPVMAQQPAPVMVQQLAPVMAQQPAPATAAWSAPVTAQQPARTTAQQPAPVTAEQPSQDAGRAQKQKSGAEPISDDVVVRSQQLAALMELSSPIRTRLQRLERSLEEQREQRARDKREHADEIMAMTKKIWQLEAQVAQVAMVKGEVDKKWDEFGRAPWREQKPERGLAAPRSDKRREMEPLTATPRPFPKTARKVVPPVQKPMTEGHWPPTMEEKVAFWTNIEQIRVDRKALSKKHIPNVVLFYRIVEGAPPTVALQRWIQNTIIQHLPTLADYKEEEAKGRGRGSIFIVYKTQKHIGFDKICQTLLDEIEAIIVADEVVALCRADGGDSLVRAGDPEAVPPAGGKGGEEGVAGRRAADILGPGIPPSRYRWQEKVAAEKFAANDKRGEARAIEISSDVEDTGESQQRWLRSGSERHPLQRKSGGGGSYQARDPYEQPAPADGQTKEERMMDALLAADAAAAADLSRPDDVGSGSPMRLRSQR